MSGMSEWQALVAEFLVQYAREHPLFTAEEAWAAWAQVMGHVAPPHQNSLGAAFRNALIKPGYVYAYGIEKATNKAAKKRGVIRWKSLICTDGHELVSVQVQLAQIHSDVNQRKITLLEGLNKAYQIGAGVGGF